MLQISQVEASFVMWNTSYDKFLSTSKRDAEAPATASEIQFVTFKLFWDNFLLQVAPKEEMTLWITSARNKEGLHSGPMAMVLYELHSNSLYSRSPILLIYF